MDELPPFERRFFDPERRQARIGAGALGGKAQGLILAKRVLTEGHDAFASLDLEIEVPSLVVLGGAFFEAFLDRNGLQPLATEEVPDEEVKEAFAKASLPAEGVGDLRAVADEVRVPLAVRSSSTLEDALGQPFAGVYGTKMIPCTERDADGRFRSLVDAIKFVYATTLFAKAKAYTRATGRAPGEEEMAVIIQEVVGRGHDERHYPDISGVARSYGYYPLGPASPEDGVAHLAVGLGKTIVDGGVCWPFCPTYPRARPPFGTERELLGQTQTRFWAIHLGPPPAYDPMNEAEYLVSAGLAEAEVDGALRYATSTWDARSDRLVPGMGREGPRVLDFAPILANNEVPLAKALQILLPLCERAVGAPVEIEFALTLPPAGRPRLGLLQVRPLLTTAGTVEVTDDDLANPRALLASVRALGNGQREVEDVIYVEPTTFDAACTEEMAAEIEGLNRALVELGRPCLLIGFGRWGSSDPWLGIPVRWDQIASVAGLVEATTPGMSPEPSQGSHFFHNLSSFGVLYFSVPREGSHTVDWGWLQRQPIVTRGAWVRHVRSEAPLVLKVDGRTRRGVVMRGGGS